MFKNPFSFSGRIRRTEYGLSMIIYIVVIAIFQIIIESAVTSSSGSSVVIPFVTLLVFIPCIFFMFAQGAKRCHDLGNSGWFQLIPLYGFWMLFANSEHGENAYGENPKGIGNTGTQFSFEENQQASETSY